MKSFCFELKKTGSNILKIRKSFVLMSFLGFIFIVAIFSPDLSILQMFYV